MHQQGLDIRPSIPIDSGRRPHTTGLARARTVRAVPNLSAGDPGLSDPEPVRRQLILPQQLLSGSTAKNRGHNTAWSRSEM